MLIHYAILALALFGFAICLYIHVSKQRRKPLVCFIGKDCTEVVQSSYSHFLTIAHEDLGIGYYLSVLLTQLSFLIFPPLHTVAIAKLFLAVTGIAALYSTYLLYAQLIIIKQWCEWCLILNSITILLCILAFF